MLKVFCRPQSAAAAVPAAAATTRATIPSRFISKPTGKAPAGARTTPNGFARETQIAPGERCAALPQSVAGGGPGRATCSDGDLARPSDTSARLWALMAYVKGC